MSGGSRRRLIVRPGIGQPSQASVPEGPPKWWDVSRRGEGVPAVEPRQVADIPNRGLVHRLIETHYGGTHDRRVSSHWRELSDRFVVQDDCLGGKVPVVGAGFGDCVGGSRVQRQLVTLSI